MGNKLGTTSNQEPLIRQDQQPLISEDLVVETRSHDIDIEAVGEQDQQPQIQPVEVVPGGEQSHELGDGDNQLIEGSRLDEQLQVTHCAAGEKNIIIHLWEKVVELLRKVIQLLTPSVPSDGNEPEDNQYTEGIVTITSGFRIKIDEVKDLDPLADLVKQKIELEKYIETIFKSGRDSRKDIIMTIAGTLLLGMLNVIIEGLLADHIPFEMRMIVLGIFTITSIIFLGGAIYEQHYIYEPALTDALSAHSTMIRRMNIHRNALMVEESRPRKEGLSIEAEVQVEKLMIDYCNKIIQPLPIYRQKTMSFILVGCVIVVLVFACVLRALSLSRSPAPAPVPYPPPHSGPF